MSEQELRQHGGCDPLSLTWLCTPHLTSQLKQVCQEYQFNVLSESWQSSLLPFEQALLGIATAEMCWIRASCHREAGRPVIFARVIVPHPTFQAYETEFLNLKGNPIGDTLLFRNPQVKRSAFIYGLNKNRSIELVWDAEPFECLWMRASVFHWGEHPLLISEFFSTQLPLLPL